MALNQTIEGISAIARLEVGLVPLNAPTRSATPRA